MASESASEPPSSASSPDGRTGRLIVVSGPSGVGKSSVVARLTDRIPFHFSVSATTRLPRLGEVDGVHYFFVDRQRFGEMIERGELLEWAEYSGELYGTPRRAVLDRLASGEDVLLDIELQGAVQVMDAHPETVSIFLVPPSLTELERRLRSRGDTGAEQIRRRLEIAAWQLEVAAERFGHMVLNDELDRVVDEIRRILDPPEESST